MAYGSYWENLRSWWVLRDQPNVLILSYEEMQADLAAVVGKVATFLEVVLTAEQVAAIAGHCSLDSMRSNPMTNASSMPAIVRPPVFTSISGWLRSVRSWIVCAIASACSLIRSCSTRDGSKKGASGP